MISCFYFFFFKQKTAYEMRISDWSSDVCSSDLLAQRRQSLAQTLTRLHLEAPTPEQAGKFLARVRLPGVAREKGEQRTRPHSGQGDLPVRAGKRETYDQAQILVFGQVRGTGHDHSPHFTLVPGSTPTVHLEHGRPTTPH